jgi:hypothetical protein
MTNAFKSSNKRGQHNWTKILCLAVGLAAASSQPPSKAGAPQQRTPSTASKPSEERDFSNPDGDKCLIIIQRTVK